MAVQTDPDSADRKDAETERVMALWMDTKGELKDVPYFTGRWLFEPKHLAVHHIEHKRKRTEEEKKEIFEQCDPVGEHAIFDDNALVRSKS